MFSDKRSEVVNRLKNFGKKNNIWMGVGFGIFFLSVGWEFYC